MIDCIQMVECRQLSEDTFMLRNASHEVTLNKEGFDMYRTGTKEFEKFMDENLIESYPREPNGS